MRAYEIWNQTRETRLDIQLAESPALALVQHLKNMGYTSAIKNRSNEVEIDSVDGPAEGSYIVKSATAESEIDVIQSDES
jgi:hypothetical protein